MRYAFVFTCVAFSLSSGCAAQPYFDARNRSELTEGYSLIFQQWDADRDGKLSKAEQLTMVESDLSDWPDDGVPPNAKTMREYLLTEMEDADSDRDSHVSRAEFLAPILKEFDCNDRDNSGTLSEQELLNSADCATSRPIVISSNASR